MNLKQEFNCSKKKRYPDRISAEIMRTKFLTMDTVKDRKKYASRAYECPVCKGWHLTSQPLQPQV